MGHKNTNSSQDVTEKCNGHTKKNSFSHLKAAGIPVAQTASYPLVLADINGNCNMHSSQKKFIQKCSDTHT